MVETANALCRALLPAAWPAGYGMTWCEPAGQGIDASAHRSRRPPIAGN